MTNRNAPALPFAPADILIPKEGHEKWAVIACDQYTSQPEYWAKADETVGGEPSALRITLPEIYLNDEPEKRIAAIRENMDEYLAGGIFAEYKDALVYVERTLPDGRVRRGIVGAVDLEAYDYNAGSHSQIRATEGTVLERIPPRVKIRQGAPIESPHVMILIDDKAKKVIEPLSSLETPLLYDFDLMLGGGHLRGRLIPGEEKEKVLAGLAGLSGSAPDALLFAMGDGNHSLATAKACYEADKNPLARYALAEIVNIHDDALDFEPIYRVVFNADVPKLLAKLKAMSVSGDGQRVEYVTAGQNGEIFLKPATPLTVGTLQAALDAYKAENPAAEIDYIHGEDVARRLGLREGAVSFIFDGMSKDELFPSVAANGTLPRKTFSLGHADDKRFYMECRRIK